MKLITYILIIFSHLYNGTGNLYAQSIDSKPTFKTHQNIVLGNFESTFFISDFDIDLEDDCQFMDNEKVAENENLLLKKSNFLNFNFPVSDLYSSQKLFKNYPPVFGKKTPIYLKNSVLKI